MQRVLKRPSLLGSGGRGCGRRVRRLVRFRRMRVSANRERRWCGLLHTGGIFEDNSDVFFCFDDIVEPDDVGVLDELEDIDFAGDLDHPGLGVDVAALDEFDGDLFTRDDVNATLGRCHLYLYW